MFSVTLWFVFLAWVDAAPAPMPELESEQPYWSERDTESRRRVRGEDLRGGPGLETLSNLHGVQQGKNFRVSESE